MEKEIFKTLKKLEEKWGIEAWNDLMDVFWKFQLRIDDLLKSREKWKAKYHDMKEKYEALKEQSN